MSMKKSVYVKLKQLSDQLLWSCAIFRRSWVEISTWKLATLRFLWFSLVPPGKFQDSILN